MLCLRRVTDVFGIRICCPFQDVDVVQVSVAD